MAGGTKHHCFFFDAQYLESSSILLHSDKDNISFPFIQQQITTTVKWLLLYLLHLKQENSNHENKLPRKLLWAVLLRLVVDMMLDLHNALLRLVDHHVVEVEEEADHPLVEEEEEVEYHYHVVKCFSLELLQLLLRVLLLVGEQHRRRLPLEARTKGPR
jgi:hypothetical protein